MKGIPLKKPKEAASDINPRTDPSTPFVQNLKLMVFASNVHFYVGHLHNPQFITSFVSTVIQDRQTTRRAKYSHLHGAENICIFKGRLADWWMRGGGGD